MPAEVTSQIRDEVFADGTISAASLGVSAETLDGILDALQKGFTTVFILYVPLVGACLLISLLFKVRLRDDELLRAALLTCRSFCRRWASLELHPLQVQVRRLRKMSRLEARHQRALWRLQTQRLSRRRTT